MTELFLEEFFFHINFKLPNAEQLMELWKFHLGMKFPNRKIAFHTRL